MPNTKIVATLGPASDSLPVLRELMEAGVDVFRLNASHGTQPQHAERIRNVRALAGELGRNVAVLLDLQGPKIRLGKFEKENCALVTGSEFTITVDPVLGSAQRATPYQAQSRHD